MPAKQTVLTSDDRTFSAADFRDPIKFIYAEHERIRTCCEMLGTLVENLDVEDAAATAASILSFLEQELPRHLVDEEQDLFPMLLRRSLPGDRTEPIIELLRLEHRDDVEFGHALLEPLHAISTGHKPDNETWLRNYVATFQKLQHRHHALEDKVVLPFANDRLTSEDMAELGRKMATRRGLSL